MVQANPDIETLKLTLWVAVGLIMLLIGVIAYLAKLKDSNALAQVEKLSTVVDTVQETVNSLKSVVEVIKTQFTEDRPRTERRLNEHAERIDKHAERLVKIETKLNID
jgi:predicted RND superfamily exporter protein